MHFSDGALHSALQSHTALPRVLRGNIIEALRRDDLSSGPTRERPSQLQKRRDSHRHHSSRPERFASTALTASVKLMQGSAMMERGSSNQEARGPRPRATLGRAAHGWVFHDPCIPLWRDELRDQ